MKLESKWSNSETILMDTFLLKQSSTPTSNEAEDMIRLALEKDGLHTPLAVHLNDDGDYVVVMGNRRLRAALDMGYYKIAVNVFPSKEEAEEFGLMVRKINRGMK